jgi:hypothetical protein
MVYEYLPHDPGGNSKEMAPIFRSQGHVADKSHVRLVDQTGRLQGMLGSLLREILCSTPTKLVINEREQTVGSILVSILPLLQEVGYFMAVEHLRGIVSNYLASAKQKLAPNEKPRLKNVRFAPPISQ